MFTEAFTSVSTHVCTNAFAPVCFFCGACWCFPMFTVAVHCVLLFSFVVVVVAAAVVCCWPRNQGLMEAKSTSVTTHRRMVAGANRSTPQGGTNPTEKKARRSSSPSSWPKGTVCNVSSYCKRRVAAVVPQSPKKVAVHPRVGSGELEISKLGLAQWNKIKNSPAPEQDP